MISDERRSMGELWDAPYEMGSSIENRLKLRCISLRKPYLDRITIINSGTDQIMNQNRDSMQDQSRHCDWWMELSWRK